MVYVFTDWKENESLDSSLQIVTRNYERCKIIEDFSVWAEKRLGGVGEDSIENYNPSCRMCNFYKGMNTIEQFRRRLQKELDYKRTFATRMALKYGILTEHKWDGKFYFEKIID